MGLATLDESKAIFDQLESEMGWDGPAANNPQPATIPPLTAPVGPFDMSTLAGHQALVDGILGRREAVEADRLAPPRIGLYDGGVTLRGECVGWLSVDYEFIENDTGTAVLKLPLAHYLAQWVMNFAGRTKRNVIVTIDKQGSRWSGFMDHYTVNIEITDAGRITSLEVFFKHDYEALKHILAWANPFLLAEIQFPKLWVIFGPAKWCLLMTLFVNIFRLETAIWTLPDNPLDILEWFPLSLNTGEWQNIVIPFSLADDNSNTTIVFSRFKTMHDVFKGDLADAQLTVDCRRYMPSLGDLHPFMSCAGPLGLTGTAQEISDQLLSMVPIREGCVCWNIIDNSGWTTQTSFGGSWLTGLIRAYVSIADDGVTQGIDYYSGNPTFPGDYYTPGFLGTDPSAPWVVYDCGPLTGVRSTKFEYYEETDAAMVTGGHSMPGVNEFLSAGVNMVGDFVTSFINSMIGAATAAGPFDCIPAIDIPPLGGVMDALAKILYEDTFLAFMQSPTLRASPAGELLPIAGLMNTATYLGDFFYEEGWCDGADRAFTLSSLLAVRAKIWQTRARTHHEVNACDAAPYVVGYPGYGHYWLGNRICTSFPEFPLPDTLFVERVKKLGYGWDENGPKGWRVNVGEPEQNAPALKAMEKIRDINAALSCLGIL